MSHLELGVGTSRSEGTAAAVAESVAQARAALGGRAPGLAVVAATVDHDAAAVHEAVRRALPGVPIHGATSSLGVLGIDGIVMGGGGGVGVLLFAGGGDIRFAAGSAPLDGGAREAGLAAAKALAAAGPAGAKPRMILIAATPGDEEGALAGIGEVFPGVPVFGGSAADHAIAGEWSVFTDKGPQKSAVSLAAIWGDVRIGSAFGGPYAPSGEEAPVTEVRGRTLVKLGGEPASAVLHRWIGSAIDEQVASGGNLLMQTSLSPLGIAHPTARGAFHALLHPAQAHADGTIDLFARAAPGAQICLMRGSLESLVGIVDDLAEHALAEASMRPADVRGALLIYCAGCAGAIGDHINDVLAKLRAKLGKAPLLGFCTFGEQGFVPDLGNVHSNLSVGLVLFG